MSSRRASLIVAVATVVFGGTTLSAQEQNDTRGLFIGAILNPVMIHSDVYTADSSSRTRPGIGLGVQGGYNMPHLIGFFVRVEDAVIPRSGGNFTLLNVDYGIRIRAAALQKYLRGGTPYAEAAFNNRMTKQKNLKREGEVYDEINLPIPDVASDGLQGSFGLGIDYPLAKRTRFSVGVTRTSGKFDSVRFGGGAVWSVEWWDATDYRLHIGITRQLGPKSH